MAGKKRPGDLAGKEENEDMVKEVDAEEEDASKPGEEAHGKEEHEEMKTGEELKRGGRHKKRARGGHVDGDGELDGAIHHKFPSKEQKPHHPHHHPRKRGGHVPGEAAKHRPDRRARGGATSDLNPTTAAGKMSVPEYERQPKIPNGGGEGASIRKN